MRTFTIKISIGTDSDKQKVRVETREKAFRIGAAVMVVIGAILSLGAL